MEFIIKVLGYNINGNEVAVYDFSFETPAEATTEKEITATVTSTMEVFESSTESFQASTIRPSEEVTTEGKPVKPIEVSSTTMATTQPERSTTAEAVKKVEILMTTQATTEASTREETTQHMFVETTQQPKKTADELFGIRVDTLTNMG